MENIKKTGCVIGIITLTLLIGFFAFFISIWVDFYDLTDNQARSIVSNADFLFIEKYLIRNSIKSIAYSKDGLNGESWNVNGEKVSFDRDSLIVDSKINGDSLKLVLMHIKNFEFFRVDVDSLTLDFRLRNSSPISQGFGILTIKSSGKINLDSSEFVEYTKIDETHYKYREFVE